MWLFKKKVVQEIRDGAWGHLVNDHGLNVDELSRDIRCVTRPGEADQVKHLRVFSLRDVGKRGVTVAGWETFDQHPELILFEGLIDADNEAHLERKNGTGR